MRTQIPLPQPKRPDLLWLLAAIVLAGVTVVLANNLHTIPHGTFGIALASSLFCAYKYGDEEGKWPTSH